MYIYINSVIKFTIPVQFMHRSISHAMNDTHTKKKKNHAHAQTPH